jgi:hypothetical protein
MCLSFCLLQSASIAQILPIDVYIDTTADNSSANSHAVIAIVKQS